jgi:FlaA1/EpsC-like NDP-sugar epimerase
VNTGSDIAASKAAFAEIRSLQCIIKAQVRVLNLPGPMSQVFQLNICHISIFAQIPGLHVPLMGVFRLHGHTIIASAIAPIGKMNRTLIYGSDDAGQSFVNRRASAIEPVAKSLCQKLGMHLSIKSIF